jgi:DNA segregation ATPase FtsK/SpoIIIE-like protein
LISSNQEKIKFRKWASFALHHLVVDEFLCLIMTAGKEVEVPIARLAQLARAIGIHLVYCKDRLLM